MSARELISVAIRSKERMPAKNEDLHGNVPDNAAVALLLIDVINDLEFAGGEELFHYALPIAERLAALKKWAKQAGIPAVYVNDNFGKWRSDFRKLVEHCLHDEVRGKPLAELLQPEEDDYFVLKPKHSGFFSTTLNLLLDYLKAQTLILTGIAGNICVLFTAHDAFMRDFHLFIPRDCIASASADVNDRALQHMQTVLEADTRQSTELTLERLQQRTK
jgi:nicotinamidase-related amidase